MSPSPAADEKEEEEEEEASREKIAIRLLRTKDLTVVLMTTTCSHHVKSKLISVLRLLLPTGTFYKQKKGDSTPGV